MEALKYPASRRTLVPSTVTVPLPSGFHFSVVPSARVSNACVSLSLY